MADHHSAPAADTSASHTHTEHSASFHNHDTFQHHHASSSHDNHHNHSHHHSHNSYSPSKHHHSHHHHRHHSNSPSPSPPPSYGTIDTDIENQQLLAQISTYDHNARRRLQSCPECSRRPDGIESSLVAACSMLFQFIFAAFAVVFVVVVLGFIIDGWLHFPDHSGHGGW